MSIKKLPVNYYQKRLAKVKRELAKRDPGSAMLVSSATPCVRSNDLYYPYRQDSNFYYLTGSKLSGLSLLIVTNLKEPILYASPQNKGDLLYHGKRKNLKTLADNLGTKLILLAENKIDSEILKNLRGLDSFYTSNFSGSRGDRLTQKIKSLKSWHKNLYPRSFKDLNLILAELRLVKDSYEIARISEAIKLTNTVFHELAPQIKAGKREDQILAYLEYLIKSYGASVESSPMIASGPNASIIHYLGGNRRLRTGEPLLIDCYINFEMYNADISRVFPVGGKFKGIYQDLYQLVNSSQKAAISKLKAGASYQVIEKAVARIMITGLKGLKILRGSNQALLAANKQRPYTIHPILHSLGIDLHDLTPFKDRSHAKLREGMVIALEPGLYF